MAIFAVGGSNAAACPTPPGDCIETIENFLPDFAQGAPEASLSLATNISFMVGPAIVWANVSTNASTEDSSGRLHVLIGALHTLRVTVFPSNETTATNASVWINSTHPDVYTQGAFRQAPLDLVNFTGTAVGSGFLIVPGSLQGDYGIHVDVTIGNETGSGTVEVFAEQETPPFDWLPVLTFGAGLLLGFALAAFLGRRMRSRPGRPRA